MAAPWGLEEKPISCPAAGLTGNTLPLTNTAVCQRAREGRYSTSPIPSWPTPEMAGKAHRLIHLAQSPEWGDSKRLVVTPLSGCLFFSPLMSAVQQIFFFFSTPLTSPLLWVDAKWDVTAQRKCQLDMTDDFLWLIGHRRLSRDELGCPACSWSASELLAVIYVWVAHIVTLVPLSMVSR